MIENLIPLIPIALFIAFRIIAARKKTDAQQEQRECTASNLLEPDILLLEPAEKTVPPERIREKESVTPEPQPDQASKPDTLQAEGKSKFPDTLNRLSPLKRGIVWAEILDSPKAYKYN